MGPFGHKHCGLDGIETAVHADERVVVAFDAAMGADGAHFIGEFVVAGEQRAAFAVATQGFRGEEAGAGNLGDAAAALAVLGRAEALGGVFDDGDVVFCGDFVDCVAAGHLAEQADWDDGFGARGYGGFDLADVDVVGVGFDVDEDGFCAN